MKELSRLAGERPALKKYLDMAQNKPESKGLSLFDYLIMPVQRVPRYYLFFYFFIFIFFILFCFILFDLILTFYFQQILHVNSRSYQTHPRR